MTAATLDQLQAAIRAIPDFPEPGILFRDITPMLADPLLFRSATDAMLAPFREAGITRIAAIESRGFLLGAPIALALGVGFVPVRKAGKLPSKTIQERYSLEYGVNAVEIHEDALTPDDRVLIVDDVLATGGTAAAALRLVERLGATVVGITVLIELSFLEGRNALPDTLTHSVIAY